MNKLKFLSFFLFSCIVLDGYAQELMPKIEDTDVGQLFDLPAVVTLTDGNKIVGTMVSAYLSKGHLTNVSFKLQDGSTQKYKPNEIESLKVRCVKPSIFTLVDSAGNEIRKVINTQFVFDHPFRTDKKVKPEMMQLLNPVTSSRIRIYADPNANVTRSISIKGEPLPGSGISAYIFIKENETYYINQNSYEKLFKDIYGDCQEMMKAFSGNPINYGDLAGHVLLYDHHCGIKK